MVKCSEILAASATLKSEGKYYNVCIFMKRMCEQECLHSKRKVLSPDFKEMKTLKALKETVRCVYRPSHGNEQSFSFTDT